MKKVLCFGDSNTYGFIPAKGMRYGKSSRWTGILQKLGKEDLEVVEAGCNNRTCVADNPAGKEFTGYKILPDLLDETFNAVILAIGSNDLQFGYAITKEDLIFGMKQLINIVNSKSPNAEIILASPSHIRKNVLNGFFSTLFDESSIEKSKYLSELYQEIAQDRKCKFIDLEKVAKPSEKDGLHYDDNAHKLIAEAIYKLL